MRRYSSGPGVTGSSEAIDWELRPGGMLVQKRDDGDGSDGQMVRIKVSHGASQHEVTVPSQSSFGELKSVLARETGLEPQEQRLLFRGKEKDDEERLHMVGVTDMSKVLLLEDPASKEQKLEQMKRDEGVARACEAVSHVREEVDKLAEQVSALESAVREGAKVPEKEFDVSMELLMKELLKLDGIEAEGEAKVQRRSEVRRVQNYFDTLDKLKARNSNPFIDHTNAASVTAQWETFESGMGSLSAPRPMPSTAKVTDNWERFE